MPAVAEYALLSPACSLRSSGPRGVYELDRRPRLDLAAQEDRIPVGQPHAAARGRVPDSFRRIRAVNTVMWFRQLHPDLPDGIVRPRRNERVLLILALAQQFRLIMPGRVIFYGCDLIIAAW